LVRGLILAPLALPSLARADAPRSVELTKAFPYLEKYLAFPASRRNQFSLAYVARRGYRPAPDFKAMIVEPGGQRMPLPLQRDGCVARLPTLAELRGGAMLETDDAAGDVHLVPEVRANAPASTHVDPAQLCDAMAQLNAAAATLSGMLSFMIPKFDTVFFPDSGGGQAVFAGGRTAPLPVTVSHYLGATPYFVPASDAGAHDLVLARAPSRMLIGTHPKT
jgi:hypothetical protein